ncbi:MAG: putative nucleotidyltransferase substrate binding domain-containing protein [Campylobacterota bacterium]|nr:putative nucleotidyltransferase substrate binding domain-containing protein [Campylobacterota bacterium]
MSLHDQQDFIQSIHPFEELNSEQITQCQKAMNIGYYPKDTVLISSSHIADHFFIIIKGEVNEYNDDELTAVYHPQDSFDADSLMYGKTNSTFKVSEDLICYELDKKTFLHLLEQNERFKKFYLRNLSSRLQTLKKKEYANDMSGFMVARVSELYLNKACIVSPQCSIGEAIQKSIEYKTSSIIVQQDTEYGIITDSILKKDVLLKGKSLNDPVKDIATFPYICVNSEDFLFQVLLLLTQHTIKRVGVLKEGKLIGNINQIDVLSYFANHVHLIAVQIQKAQTPQDLQNASADITKTVKSLYNKSVRTTYIAKMVGQLNAKVYEKLFELVVPQELRKQCTLVVMGSEGRDEQILKTDQDNALIVKDGVDVEQYRVYMKEFISHLIEFGFPPCDGNIMVSNPFWCKSYTQFEQQINSWIEGSSMEDYMNLAIFFDAKVVAGDESLIVALKNKLFAKIDNKDVFMAYFAKATLTFDTPIGIFSNIIAKNDEVDLKKGAIFAIVQGVRSLSLEHKLDENSTIARIKKLNQLNVIQREMASELIEAFGLLLRLKLQGQMLEINEGKKIDNIINLNNLGKIQRDMLKDSFQIVNNFKKFITHHFRLSSVM